MISELFETDFREAFVDFADNPQNTFRVYQLSDHIRIRPAHQDLVKLYLRDQKAQVMYSEGYAIDTLPDLEKLSRLAPGTLGGAYARFMLAQNLTPDFYVKLSQIACEQDFVEQRLRHDHDLWHIISGFDTSYAGEMGVVTLYLAQLKLPVAAAMLSTCFARLIDHSEEVDDVLDCMVASWHWGKKCESFLGFPWEEHWEEELGLVRSDLGLPINGIAPTNQSIPSWDDRGIIGGKDMQVSAAAQI